MESNSILARKEFVIGVIKHVRPIDVIVIFASVVAMYIFRIQDGYQLNPIWQLKRSSGGQQVTHVPPLIADLDGNSLKELIIASEDKMEVFSYHADEFDNEHEREKDDTSSVLYHLHQKAEISFNDIHGGEAAAAKYPVAMTSGCTASTTLHNDVCSLQVLAVVWSDWTVTLLSRQLKVLWRSKPLNITFQPKLQITEMSVLVAAGNKSVFGENGLVIVGGVLNLIHHKTSDSLRHDHSHDHSQRLEVNKTAEEISRERAGVEPEKENSHAFSHDLDPDVAGYVGHFTSYALDGGTGEIRWKHEPGDFEVKPEYNEDQQSLHFKLRLKKKAVHRGEVHWKKYSQSFLNHLPYSWAYSTDSAISLGQFKRSSASKPKRTEGDIAEQLMELAKTGVPSVRKKETRDLNVVVISHSRGIEVLNLEKGSPLCSLPLNAQYSTLGDVNADENIDLVKLHVDQENSMSRCFVVASDALLTSSVLFNSSVCHPSSAVDFFGEVTSSVDKNIKLQSLPPLLTKTVRRSFGILGHVLGHGLSRYHVGMDTVVLTSLGKLTAFEPSGRFLWQVNTGVTWSENDLQHSFTPSMKAISLSLEGTQDGVVILGSHELIIISLVDGSILSTHSLPCVPTQPLVLGDINNDISDEFLVRCSDRYIAFSLERYNRIGLTILVYSGIACLVGFQLFVIKFFEREEFPYDTFNHVLKALRLFPLQGIKL